MPLEPPCTSKVSSPFKFPLSNTLLQTVKKVSGNEAASSKLNAPGMGKHCPSGIAQYSAYPPPVVRAQTLSPTSQRLTLLPVSVMMPATSNPGISCGASFGGG